MSAPRQVITTITTLIIERISIRPGKACSENDWDNLICLAGSIVHGNVDFRPNNGLISTWPCHTTGESPLTSGKRTSQTVVACLRVELFHPHEQELGTRPALESTGRTGGALIAQLGTNQDTSLPGEYTSDCNEDPSLASITEHAYLGTSVGPARSGTPLFFDLSGLFSAQLSNALLPHHLGW